MLFFKLLSYFLNTLSKSQLLLLLNVFCLKRDSSLFKVFECVKFIGSRFEVDLGHTPLCKNLHCRSFFTCLGHVLRRVILSIYKISSSKMTLNYF